MEFSKIIKKLEKLPQYSKSEFLYWGDYLELLCLINKSGQISRNEFIDRFKNRVRDLGEGEAEEAEQEASTPVYVKNDEDFTFAEDVFKVIEFRRQVFKDAYPFELSEDLQQISIVNSLTELQKLYILLLISSNLAYFGSIESELTKKLEQVAEKVLSICFPGPLATVLIFGKGGGALGGTFWTKLNGLASMLREKVQLTEEELSKHNTGDGGLDILGYFSFGDSQPHSPIIFGQCTCKFDWYPKQNEVKYDRWSNFVSLTTNPLCFMIIPQSFRKANGEWHDRLKIERTVLLDRQRILFILTASKEKVNFTAWVKVVSDFLAKKEAVV